MVPCGDSFPWIILMTHLLSPLRSFDKQCGRDAEVDARLLQVPGQGLGLSYPPKRRTAVTHSSDSSRLSARYLASA